MISFDVFNKNAYSFLSNQFIPYTINYIFALILCQNVNPFIVCINLLIILLHTYLIHRFLHSIQFEYKLHMKYHHSHNKDEIKDKNYKLIQIRNLIIETLVNIGFFVLFYIIKVCLRIDFIKPILIFYVGFIYVTMHNINYSIFHLSKIHVNHHKYKNKNFGPDAFDHLFNTNIDKKYENLNHMLPNKIISFILSVLIFKPKIFY